MGANPPPFCLTPPFLVEIFRPSPISINFEKVQPPWGEVGSYRTIFLIAICFVNEYVVGLLIVLLFVLFIALYIHHKSNIKTPNLRLIYWKFDFNINSLSELSNLNVEPFLTLQVPISQNGQIHSNNSASICRRIVWMCLAIL